MKARSLRPNQYIWRRRVEQYGPRQTKPYPFYDWVQTAGREIRARGDIPVNVSVPPTGSEIAGPAREWDAESHDGKAPDPQGRIARDTQGLVLAEATTVPTSVKPGEVVRVHLTLRPNDTLHAHWNNEAEQLKVWIDLPPGWQASSQLLVAPQPDQPESSEPRRLEFEIRTAPDARGATNLTAYALCYICEEATGTCTFLRHDIPLTVAVDK
jgi:hypothetical protein